MKSSRPDAAKATMAGQHAAQAFDGLLVTLICAGDRKAAANLARRWQPRLLRTARRLLGDEEQAASAVQDAWLGIMRKIHTLKDPARFAPWAFSILRRKCADVIRKASKRRAVFASSPPDDLANNPPVETATDDAVAIKQAFANLPDDQRLAAHLYFIEGLTLAEIAEAQSIPTGTAKSRLFHARQKLKAALSDISDLGEDT